MTALVNLLVLSGPLSDSDSFVPTDFWSTSMLLKVGEATGTGSSIFRLGEVCTFGCICALLGLYLEGRFPDRIRSEFDCFGFGEIRGCSLEAIGTMSFMSWTGNASEMKEGTVGRLTEEKSSAMFLVLAGEINCWR